MALLRVPRTVAAYQLGWVPGRLHGTASCNALPAWVYIRVDPRQGRDPDETRVDVPSQSEVAARPQVYRRQTTNVVRPREDARVQLSSSQTNLSCLLHVASWTAARSNGFSRGSWRPWTSVRRYAGTPATLLIGRLSGNFTTRRPVPRLLPQSSSSEQGQEISGNSSSNSVGSGAYATVTCGL